MPDLDFQVESVEAVPFAVAPLLNFKLRVDNSNPDEWIQTVALRCQIQIEPTRRHYDAKEQEKMLDLFGEPERWGQTLKTMLWTHASTVVSPFQNSTTVDLPVNCTFDFNVAGTKYFAGLAGGEVPLLLLFSGTCFYEAEDGAIQIAQISWSKETKFQLPVSVWQEMMEHYYPNSAWLILQRDAFERLQKYKMQRGIPTFEQALEKLLAADEAEIKKSVSF
ncbi:MAG: DUF6084 family protein [Acidobacteriota bacterium]|nr:DUF6084 family protein [Acidobacteriota bacterium]